MRVFSKITKHVKKLKNFVILFLSSSRIVLKLIIVDQISKWWLIGKLKTQTGYIITVSSFFDIVYSWNYGISFGWFRDYYQYSNSFFLVLNSIIVFFIIYLSLKAKTGLSFIAYSLINGGALGNLCDRVVHGAVFDFIYFHYKGFGFPAFNLADSFISVGAALLIYDYYKQQRKMSALNEISAEFQIEYDEATIQAEEIRTKRNMNFS